ncbi:MAG: hypothetical protein WD989_00605 [Candidatus Paceibacterota bacterium]
MYRRIALILVFVFFASLLVHPIYSINQDIGRHLKSGQIIWETGDVYKTNLFSFTEPDHRFINHHWLSEVVFYWTNRLFNIEALIILKVVVLLTALALIFLAVKNISSAWALILSALAGIAVFIERTDVRPEIFSYLFLSFFLFAIFRAKYSPEGEKWSRLPKAVEDPRYRKAISGLYALPVVQLFWSNMHIYFVLGPILMLFFLIDQRKYLPIFLATGAATLVNPNFISGALYPLRILNSYGYTIAENQNIFFLRDYGISVGNIQIFQLSVVMLAVSFFVAWRKHHRDLFELLTAGFFTIMAFLMLRNFGIYALAFIPIVALNLSTVLPLTTLDVVSPQRHRVSLYVAISVVLALLIWNNVRADKFSLAIPPGAAGGVKFIQDNNISGPVFNNFDVGSFLIWKTFPEQKVFVDGRPEAYSVDFFEKIYKPMQEDPVAWERYSKEYGINYVFFDHRDMTPWAKTFLNRISQDKRWPMVYSDEYVAIFLKRLP